MSVIGINLDFFNVYFQSNLDLHRIEADDVVLNPSLKIII